ncbi:MAG TPA: heparan-alpha-glucosaminide N-acetyltransferase domain-containing protein [Candidatus Angelobacter sp.]|nr:heparan-alpha-glucosaminide N-acetyltransferase domain-containing protein [Candidatus Angelobacter sp.]
MSLTAVTKADSSVGPAASFNPGRVYSVDLLRGMVMIIMALDHTREYFSNIEFAPGDLAHTYGALFFTRWISHFCAPAFFFLAGVSIFLSAKKGPELSSFLWKRGLWLVFLELTLVASLWSFTLTPTPRFIVIWALGWAMVAMSVLVRAPLRYSAICGIGLILLHNLFDGVKPAAFGKFDWLWMILHRVGVYHLHSSYLPKYFLVIYPLIPWIGVMAAGYALGSILKKPERQRRRFLLVTGTVMVTLFLVLRATNLYGDPPAGTGFEGSGPFKPQATTMLSVIAFLNVEKYPPSLDFLLMTLGPALMLLAWFDKLNFQSSIGKVWKSIAIYGQVPMFYYIVHLFLIHLLAVTIAWLFHRPENSFGLPMVYCFWLAVVLLLYLPCRWFAGLKRRRKDWWLSYL